MNAREADPRTAPGRCEGCQGWSVVNGRTCPECKGSGLARTADPPLIPMPPVPELTPDEARLMAEATAAGTVTIPARLICGGCAGTGNIAGYRPCRWCGSRGWCDPGAVTGEP